MCRIAGIINPSLPLPTLQHLVKQMCDILAHGGPDDEGYYSSAENHLVLGNRRLALIDLSQGGHQPKAYAHDRYWITYNGELYNYPELKQELKAAGYEFNSSSDTEVILAAFAAWGTNAFKRFNGMFAFALWDDKEKMIYLVRDASGIKPLYYSTKQGLAFASEIQAFFPIEYLQKENKNWPVFLLAYGHLPEPVTTLADVKPLPKGTFLQYNLNNSKFDIEAFVHYNYKEEIDNRNDAEQQLNKCLELAVKRHLLSDAPIGVFLSGGLDSGIMALLARKYHNDQLKTLSIAFEEEKFSEKKYQDLLLK